MGESIIAKVSRPKIPFTVSNKVYPETSFAVKAKLRDFYGELLTQNKIQNVSYLIISDGTIHSSGTLEVANVVLPELRFDTDWYFDFDGYNFFSVHVAPDTEGFYIIVYKITGTDGNIYSFGVNLVVSYD